MLFKMIPLDLQAANNFCTGLSNSGGKSVKALPRFKGIREKAGGFLASHHRHVGNIARSPRRLTDKEQAVSPCSDEKNVCRLHTRKIGTPNTRKTGDLPAFLLEM
jgi:hypothetical protein